jgi:predicted RNA-binding protein YlqC (UPF0109 family)
VKDLVQFMVKPLVRHPDEVSVNMVEGAASVLLELRVHPDDLEAVRGPRGAVFHSMQQVLAIAGGARKPVLDLIDARFRADEE